MSIHGVGAVREPPSAERISEGWFANRPYAFGVMLAMLTLLGACMSSPHKQTIVGDTGWPLLSPASLMQSRQVAQVLHGEYGDKSFSLRSVVTVDAQRLQVIGLTAMGMRAFTLRYDGKELYEERSPQVPEALQARQLLNDIQLVFWPLTALRQAWQPLGADITEPDANTRRLQRNGVLMAEVRYAADPWNGTVRLQHFDHPYRLTIDSSSLGQGQ